MKNKNFNPSSFTVTTKNITTIAKTEKQIIVHVSSNDVYAVEWYYAVNAELLFEV